ncbi:MAG: hypothetical protein AAFP90_10195, partial [Planctomycetota bacterium]
MTSVPADRSSDQPTSSTQARRRPTLPPVTKRLRRVLYVVLGLFSLLAANGLYLSGVTFTQWWTGEVFENHFYQLMFLGHLGLGILLIAPVIGFGIVHMIRSRHRRNVRAIRIGYALFFIAIVILVSGVLLTRVGSFGIVDSSSRSVVYWAHILTPLFAVWLYWLHRLVGSRIKWQIGRRVALVTAVFVAIAIFLQTGDPRLSGDRAPASGRKYFEPSLASTASGKFLEARTLMNDQYCLDCHPDIHNTWIHSAHHFSSFNNPAYRASVRETRQV